MFFHAPPKSAPLNHIKVTESLLGVAVPIVFGTTRVAGKLVFDADLTAHPESASGKAKGGKAGLYAYTGTFIAALCQGPILGINSVWDQQGMLPSLSSQQSFTVPLTAPQPIVTTVAGGSLPARTYYVKVTYTYGSGEGAQSAEYTISIPANYLCYIVAPISETGVTGWNIYISETSGAETLQNSSPIPIATTSWTEPTSGITGTGAQPPTQPVVTPAPPAGGGGAGIGGSGGGTGWNQDLGVTGPTGPLKRLPVV